MVATMIYLLFISTNHSEIEQDYSYNKYVDLHKCVIF